MFFNIFEIELTISHVPDLIDQFPRTYAAANLIGHLFYQFARFIRQLVHYAQGLIGHLIPANS